MIHDGSNRADKISKLEGLIFDVVDFLRNPGMSKKRVSAVFRLSDKLSIMKSVPSHMPDEEPETAYFPLEQGTSSIKNGSSGRWLDESRELPEVFDKYDLQMKLGQGSMGTVYLGRHKQLNRHCAIKVLNPSQHRIIHDDYLSLFQDEARLMSQFNHPHIIITHDVGCEKDVHFIEMEFLSGGSLADYLRMHQQVDPVRATRLIMQAAHGLAEAHRQGLLHRDLKLGNILLASDQRAKIVDFGFAFRFKQACERDRDCLVGTPGYLAPELFERQPATPASDIYALGVCYYALLTGTPPYDTSRTSGTMLHEYPTLLQMEMKLIRDRVPDLPLEIVHCVDRMLQTSPSNRPKSAYQVMQMLSAALGELEDLDSLIHQAFEYEKNVSWKKDRNQYVVSVKLPLDRQQKVMIETTRGQISQRLVEISTTCCQRPHPDLFAENALRINARLAHGRIGLQFREGVEYYVMQDAYPLGTVDAEEIRRCVFEMAEIADTIEQELVKTDLN